MNAKLLYILSSIVKGTFMLLVIIGGISALGYIWDDQPIEGLLTFMWTLIIYLLILQWQNWEFRGVIKQYREGSRGMDRYQRRLVESADELVRIARECLCVGEYVIQIDPLKEYQDYKEVKVFNQRVMEANDYLIDARSELESLLDSELVVK